MWAHNMRESSATATWLREWNLDGPRALTVEGWSTSTDRLNIPYHAEIKILGVIFANTIEHSMNKSWANVTGPVKRHIREELKPLTTDSLRASIPLATIWHTAQVFPTPTTCTRRLKNAVARYIWKGATFPVPISTLKKPKRQGS